MNFHLKFSSFLVWMKYIMIKESSDFLSKLKIPQSFDANFDLHKLEEKTAICEKKTVSLFILICSSKDTGAKFAQS